MRTLTGIALLVLTAMSAGCLSTSTSMKFPTFTDNKPLPKGPPASVHAEQVTAKNAHSQAMALWDELEWETQHPPGVTVHHVDCAHCKPGSELPPR